MAGPAECSWESCWKPTGMPGLCSSRPDVTVASGPGLQHHLSPCPYACHSDRQNLLGPPRAVCTLCVCAGGTGKGGHRCAVHTGAQGHLVFLAEPLGQWELCAQSPTELMCVCWGHETTQSQHPASPCPGGLKH